MAKIYERNPDTGKVRSRKIVDPMKGDEDQDEGLSYDKPTTSNIRESILSDIWAANKKVVDGKWYVELSQVAEIIGGSNV